MTPKKLTVLVVEPIILQGDLIKLALARHSMQVTVCRDPASIREFLGHQIPDLILVDTHLPGQNGLDLVSDLMAEGLLGKTKVFIISSLGYPEIVQKAVKLGASDFLVKPLDTELLATRIKRCFNRLKDESSTT